MSNKRPARTAYFFFMVEKIPELRRRGYQVSGVREAVPLCSGDWAVLSAEEKERYVEKAKAWKAGELGSPSPTADLRRFGQGKSTSLPGRLSGILEQPREAGSTGAFRQQERSHKKRHKKSDDMEKNVIYIINIFSHGEMPRLCDQRFVPCEIGCVRYSLQHGVMGAFHDFIHPGELPLGFRYHCQAGSSATHQIPVSGFQLANRDYHNLFRSLCDFVCPAAGSWAPVYCQINDIYRVKWCLQWLAGKAGMENRFELLDVESLIIAYYREKLKEEPSRSSVHRLLDVVHWDYASNTRCKWHEDNDKWCCVLASCKKVTYCMSKSLASVYGVVLTPAHLPDLEPEDNQMSCSAKTIVLDGKRYQKNMDHPHRSENLSLAAAYEPGPLGMRGLTPVTTATGRGRGILRLLEDMPSSFPTNG